MAHNPTKRKTLTLTILLLALAQEIHSIPIKSAARPVHEIINENARSDVDIDELTHSNPILPYGNPLAGNSQRAKQYALNQQAMFNAERIRQHRAQLQRWTKAPQQIDSYMKAYHESQENHHLALEKLQGEKAYITPPGIDERPSKSVTDVPQRKSTLKARREVNLESKNAIKFTDEDVINNDFEKNRNHRSRGSADINPVEHQTSHTSESHDRKNGVAVKPHDNVGLTTLKLQAPEGTQSTKLYADPISNNSQNVFPKGDLKKRSYESNRNMENLNFLIKKLQHQQLTHSNALADTTMTSHDDTKTLNRPIDLFFYIKDGSPQTFQNHFASPESDFEGDHKPITEAVDDIENPQAGKTRTYGFENVLAKEQSEEVTTKSNNYHRVEDTIQAISDSRPAYHSQIRQPYEYYTRQHEIEPTHSLQYTHQPHSKETGSSNENYPHSTHIGVHRLSEDDADVSAYDIENLHYAANYEFGYRVHDPHSGNDFGHHELKEGENTKGFYHVLLPDGRMQNVKYHAGPDGFHADISYDHLHH